MSEHDGRSDSPGREIPNNSGWVTFEARVRGRRFARCLERADEAINLGEMDDAREALTEAKALWPDAPEIAEFESRIVSGPSPGAVLLASDVPRVESNSGWRGLVAASAVLLALSSLAGFGFLRLSLDPARPMPTAAVDHATSPPAEVSASSASGSASTPQESSPKPNDPILKAEKPIQEKGAAETTAPQTTAVLGAQKTGRDSAATRPATSATTPSPSRPERSMAMGTTGRSASRPFGTGLRLPDRPADPPPVTPAMERRLPLAAEAPPTASTTSAAGSVVPTAFSGGVSPVTSVSEHAPLGSRPRPDESGIRTALLRYEAAYNSLDAKAATSVWPSVDQRALGRAFDGLLSQRVSLGLCDITVIGDVGGASCAGKARWEPKIGGGLQTADRHWNFNLRRTGDGWKIEEILVR
jgi:hypothetical protein